MTMSDPLGDMLTRIRNGQRARQAVVAAPASKIRANVLEVLKREGYIRGFTPRACSAGHRRAEDRAEIRRRRAGDPRDLARLEAGPAHLFAYRPICRGAITGSASRSCRPRAASCRTTRPAPPRSAARCSAACSEVSRCRVLARIRSRSRAGSRCRCRGQTLSAKGALGTLRLVVSNEVTASIADGKVTIAPKIETKRARAMWGTTRALVNNMVTGVAKGFPVTLEINGVGYRAAVQGKTLNLQLGYSHDIAYPIPAGRQDRLREADRDHGQRRRPPAGRPGRRRDPRLPSARTLQGQGDQIRRPRRSAARKARRSKPMSDKPKPSFCAARQRVRRKSAPRRQQPAAPVGVPLVQAYLCASHRRRDGRTLAAASTLDGGLKTSLKTGADIAAAKRRRQADRRAGQGGGGRAVVFDRGAYLFHGRVKALADAAREGGLDF